MSPLDGRVVSNFIAAALAGRNIEIMGDGHATRTFQYVSYCSEGLTRLVNSSHDEQPINIGNDCDELSVADLATKIQEIVAGSHSNRSNPCISFFRRRTKDPIQRKADISQARKVLGWCPIVPLEEGLRRIIAWASETDHAVLVDEVISHEQSSAHTVESSLIGTGKTESLSLTTCDPAGLVAFSLMGSSAAHTYCYMFYNSIYT